MESIITACIIFIISLVMFVISFRSFKEKGFLFNNAYIYSSKKERANMDKKPYYRQTAIVFLLLGIVFLTIALDTIFKTEWLFYVNIVCVFITLTYAIVSSIMISKKKQ